MDLHVAMRVFVAVAEHTGFAPAARVLEMSTTAVSRHVADLEASLGVQLLRRTTRRVNLTEAGERYLRGARSLLRQAGELHSEITSFNATPQGRLRITATPGFGNYFLGPMIARFARAYPALTVEVDFSERLVDLVTEGYDAGIRSGNLSDSSMTVRRLTDIHYIACASPDYLQRCGSPQRPEDLTAHDCVYWRSSKQVTIWKFHHGDDLIEVPVKGRFRVNSVITEREGALAGLGVAVLPPGHVAEDIRSGRLVPVLQDFRSASEPISVIWPQTAAVPRKLRVFVDFLVAEIASASL